MAVNLSNATKVDVSKVISDYAFKTAIVICTILLWMIVSTLDILPSIIFPSTFAVFEAAITDYQTFANAFATTTIAVFISIILAWGAGIGIGILIGSSPFWCDVFKPILAAIFAIPFILFYPIFVAIIGIGHTSIILFASLYGFFPIALNTISAIGNIDKKYKLVGHSLGASSSQMRFSILLPLALPTIISGLRVGTGLVVIGVIVTELLLSTGGLGYLIQYNQTQFDAAGVYVSIILSLFIVYVTNKFLTLVQSQVEYTS